MKIRVRVLDLWVDECFGSKWPKTSFDAPKKFFKIYGLMSVLGPSSPKLVFKPRIPSLKYFLKFDTFVIFKL